MPIVEIWRANSGSLRARPISRLSFSAAGAGTIDDHDRLSPCGGESRAERAGQKIDGACGRVGDHDLDRAIGIFGARRRRSGDQKGGKCDAKTAH
jgi:hypothetical protein